jgi:MFS family permease
VIALIQGITLLVANFIMKSRLPPRKAGPLIEPSAFLQPSYSLYTTGAFLAFWGIYTPFFYSTSFTQKLGAPENITQYVLSMMNAASVFGRILPNILADGLGPINVLVPTVVAAGILLFGWLGIGTWQGFIIFAMLYGFFSGTLVSLPPACVAALTDPSEMNKIGVRMGMMFRYFSRENFVDNSIISFATLTGTPIAGALISKDDGGYTSAILFSAITMIAAAVFMIFARISRVGFKIKQKT